MISSLLIIRPGAVGDFILSLPALQFLSDRAEYTEVWCPEQNLPLIHFAQHKRSIVSTGLDRVGIMHSEDVLVRLSRFEAIYSWYGAARQEFRDAVSLLPFRFFSALPPDHRLHATNFYCAQVGAKVSLPRIAVPDQRRGSFFILHPFASNSAKRWSLDCFRTLANMLGDVRWCAGPEDLARNPGLIDHPVVIRNLYELATWIGTARAYVGNDSGITHLAAAVGTPTVAIFGPTDPAVWAPMGANVRVVASRASEPVDSVTPTEVAAAVYDLL